MKYLLISTLSALLGLTACVYEPEQFEESAKESSEGSASTSALGTFFTINKDKQICNPSVSQDTVNYPGAMLWLNFGGILNVTPADSEYTVKKVVQHDRLTVTDTSNTVRWYVKIDPENGDCQFQDPEWSTHPNFVSSLLAYDIKGSRGCDNLDYGIVAFRMEDKKKFTFFKKNISEFATPHLWVDPAAVRDTSAADTTVEGFFGTKNVRLVYVTTDNEIAFIDFSKGSDKDVTTLKKPAGISGWMVDSPLISPDGNYIVFNAIDESMTGWKSYVQALEANTAPVEIESAKGAMSAPVQPHWFKFGNRLFVVWTEFPSGSQFVNTNDLTSIEDGSAGRTMMREISLNAGAPADLNMEWLDDARLVASVPMIGGRSPDGRYLATGTNKAYLLKLP